MKFLIFALFLLLITQNPSVYAQNLDLAQNSSKYTEGKYLDSKIHPILKNWQKSEDPNKFAQENNLLFNDNKITVYIHLTNEEFHSAIASMVEVKSSYKKIAVANISPEQLDALKELDAVEKITPPHLARTPPMPVQKIPLSTPTVEQHYEYLWWGVIAVLIISIIVILIYKKYPR